MICFVVLYIYIYISNQAFLNYKIQELYRISNSLMVSFADVIDINGNFLISSIPNIKSI
jgi:hypothetical protein